MKVALVYDRVNKFGGAERLLSALHDVFPEAPLFTLVYDRYGAPWANKFTVKPTFLNRISFLRRKHEWLAPIAPFAFETLDLSGYDVIISITSSDAKSIITKPSQLHICYCLTPTRYYWSGQAEYINDLKLRILPRFIHNYFRAIDLLTSARPDRYIAISQEVKKRINKYYNRNSDIIYPPIEDKFYTKSPHHHKSDYYLVVSRLVPYKKTDLAIKAFNKLNKDLYIVGIGVEEARLKGIAKDNIHFLGEVDDRQLIKIYSDAKAVIFPQEEDFGLVPVEAQACGTPVIAFGKGGALETVIPNRTGVFFSKQSASSIERAVIKFERLKILPSDCVTNAMKFSRSEFSQRMTSTISTLWQEFLLGL